MPESESVAMQFTQWLADGMAQLKASGKTVDEIIAEEKQRQQD